jgi:hypothetical protein
MKRRNVKIGGGFFGCCKYLEPCLEDGLKEMLKPLNFHKRKQKILTPDKNTIQYNLDVEE